MSKIQYSRSIPVRHEVDVFVAGGGPAGVAAAVFAARMGASVYLAEASGAFGGAATNMLIPAFMKFTSGDLFLAEGVGREVHTYLKEKSPESYRPYCPNSIPVEILKLCYDDMMSECGAKFSFFTSVLDVITADGRIDSVICSAKEGLFAVKAKIVIDCTGDADLCARAGADCRKGDEETGEVMASTLCGLWEGADFDRAKKPQRERLEDAFRDGVFTNIDRHLPGMWQIKERVTGSNVGHIYGVDGTDSDSMTGAMVAARKQLREYRRYYREYVEGYEETELVISAAQIGIRESRRVMCDYVMTLDDFMKRASFEDEIGRYSYPVDIHSGTNDDAGYKKFATEHEKLRYKSGESYGIPYRALTVKGFDNLLVAGRCISADRYMQSSVRVMPGCYITGQACGAAAAMAALADTGVRGIDVHALQGNLVRLGAYLPSYHE
ncbi:MAG: FAD-dependent oxidoreductase [Ruminococcaceae bacterium]|nr:FAD-dependent oxidoreductase [Oscillospiraceae bacterium]